MSQTVLVVSKSESSSVVEAGNGMSGFKVDLVVTDYIGISPKIFIMQREVLSASNGGTYEDQFYSVASVAQLESVPEVISDGAFYRVSSISLIFKTLEELRLYTDKILSLIDKLRIANDLATTMTGAVSIGFPATEATPRFWGFSADTTTTDEELLAGYSDNNYHKVLSETVANATTAKYLYFAIREPIGEITSLQVDGVVQTVVLVTRNVQITANLLVSYRIYRTSSTISPGGSILVEVE